MPSALSHSRLHRRRSRFACRVLAALVLPSLVAGCGGGADVDEVTEFELVPARPVLSEVDFGSFAIPIPGQTLDSDQQIVHRNYLQLEFTLFGVVQPKDRGETTRLAERRRGELRDRVIKVCRNTSPGELKDPELLTLKLRLIDAIQPAFEGVVLDTLLMRDLVIEAI